MSIPKVDLYSDRYDVPGKIYEHNPITMIRSAAAEEDNIPFGRALQLGTASDKVKLFQSATGTFVGVAGWSSQASDIDNSQFDTYDSVPVVDQGVILVYVEESVSKGDTVRIRHKDHSALLNGSFATTADSGYTAVLSGASFMADSASGVVPLFLNPPFSISADA